MFRITLQSPLLWQPLGGKTADAATVAFMDAYEKLLIVVNPTKDKLRHTLMNQTYYELLRLYSNELEKEITVLFAMGFSFADEHIREITVRAANANSTLMVHVIAYTSESKTQIVGSTGTVTVRNNNIQVVGPEQEDDGHGRKLDKFKYDFTTTNEKLFAAFIVDAMHVRSFAKFYGRGTLTEFLVQLL